MELRNLQFYFRKWHPQSKALSFPKTPKWNALLENSTRPYVTCEIEEQVTEAKKWFFDPR